MAFSTLYIGIISKISSPLYKFSYDSLTNNAGTLYQSVPAGSYETAACGPMFLQVLEPVESNCVHTLILSPALSPEADAGG